jgi:hypothetical protein
LSGLSSNSSEQIAQILIGNGIATLFYDVVIIVGRKSWLCVCLIVGAYGVHPMRVV